MDTVSFNWDLKYFLNHLSSFCRNENKPNDLTLNLVNDTLSALNDLVSTYKDTDSAPSLEPDWLCFDKEIFEFQRMVSCTLCKKSFRFNRESYMSHVATPQHNSELIKRNNESEKLACANDSPPSGSDSKDEKKTVGFNQNSNGEMTEKSHLSQRELERFIPEFFRSENNQNFESILDANSNSNGAKSGDQIIENGVTLKTFFESDLKSVVHSAIDESNKLWDRPTHSILLAANLLKDSFDFTSCHLIGSVANGTAVDENAAIDVYVDLNDNFYTPQSKKVTASQMSNVQHILIDTGEWENVQITEYSHFKKLYALHVPSQVEYHFMFGTGTFVRNNDVVKCYFDAQPICRQVVLCVRWSMKHLNDSDWIEKFSGYIISLLVIFYFQAIKALPPIKQMQENCAQKHCGENVLSFNQPKDVIVCEQRLSEVLVGFFEFYSEFDFANNVISLHEGEAISFNAETTNNVNAFPKSVLRFQQFVKNSSEKTWAQASMRAQDVLVHRDNATQSIDSFCVKEFMEYCKKSLNVLSSLGPAVSY